MKVALVVGGALIAAIPYVVPGVGLGRQIDDD